MGMSPWPVRKTIGNAPSRDASSRWRSKPLSPGRRTSNTRQPGASGRAASRNAWAVGKTSTVRPMVIIPDRPVIMDHENDGCRCIHRNRRSTNVEVALCRPPFFWSGKRWYLLGICFLDEDSMCLQGVRARPCPSKCLARVDGMFYECAGARYFVRRARKKSRARWTRDLTVVSVTPSARAMSAFVSPSTSLRTNAMR